jgi:acetoin utilization protein AcuB
MRIEEIMTKKAVTVRMDDSLSHVKDLFETHHFHHLLVVEQHKLVGIVSDRDLLKAIRSL